MNTKYSKLIIHSPNIHQGGGAVLLNELLKFSNFNMEMLVNLDERMFVSESIGNAVKLKRIKPTIFNRFLAEWNLYKKSREDEIVLFFGNLPPLFRLKSKSILYLQNKYLIEDVALGKFKAKEKLRLIIERLWFKHFCKNIDIFHVQTQTMRRCLLSINLVGSTPVHVTPFMATSDINNISSNTQKSLNNTMKFIYIASGEPHKNHLELLRAWVILSEEFIFPELLLTLDVSTNINLISLINKIQADNKLNVHNLGRLQHEEILKMYSHVNALIYPSTLESLGLPLLEAQEAGISIIASELDYVRDIVVPDQTFDPSSAISIARAVKRYLKIEEAFVKPLNASEYLNGIIHDG